MLDSTRTAVAAIFRADPSISDAERKARLAPDFIPVNTEPFDRIFTPQQAGRILGGRDRHTLAAWAKRGLLTAIKTGTGGKRATGYLESSIRKFLSGYGSGKEEA